MSFPRYVFVSKGKTIIDGVVQPFEPPLNNVSSKAEEAFGPLYTRAGEGDLTFSVEQLKEIRRKIREDLKKEIISIMDKEYPEDDYYKPEDPYDDWGHIKADTPDRHADMTISWEFHLLKERIKEL